MKMFQGLSGTDRFVARDKVVAHMESLGLLEKVDDNEMTILTGTGLALLLSRG